MEKKRINLCDGCLNAVMWTEVTYDDLYSYMRKGVKYERNSRCSKTGKIIFLHDVVKCNQHRPRRKEARSGTEEK